MTEQIQSLQRRLECFSRDLKVFWIGNRLWVPLTSQMKTCMVAFYLVFHYISRFIHLTQMVVIYWLLTA